MTTTSAPQNRLSVRSLVAALAVATTVAVGVGVAQQVGTDDVSSTQSATEVVSASASVRPSGLTQAFVDGKFDAGLVPALTVAAAATRIPVQDYVVVNGQGGLYDSFAAGKFDMSFTAINPYTNYVVRPTAASGLTAALNAGKFDAGLNAAPSSPSSWTAATVATVTLEGQGGLYDALAAGKYDLDLNPYTSFIVRPATASGLVQALNDGKFGEASARGEASVQTSPAAVNSPSVSGGHQK